MRAPAPTRLTEVCGPRETRTILAVARDRQGFARCEAFFFSERSHMDTKPLQSTILSRGSNVAAVEIRVEVVSPSLLKPPERELRKPTPQHIKGIARSINDFGFLNPIIVDADMRIIAGVSRWKAAQLLELSSVPIIRVEHLSKAQLRMFAIADNRLPEGVAWIDGALLLEFEEIELLEPDLDLSSSGFAIAEIDRIYGHSRTSELSEYDEPVEVEEGEPVNRVGDRWDLGRHDMACGDARDRELLRYLLGERKVRILLSDPPWNLKIQGVVSGQGKVKHGDFVMAAGEMSRPTFVAFLTDFIQAAQLHLVDGALMYIFMDWRNLDALHAAATASGLVQKNLLVWCKSSPSLASLYRSQHELIGLYKHGDAPHTNNIQLGRHGRNR